ncbi:hypothetical protein GCM10011351_29280 [Paraliobacillus quinghaiensis]|uniref:DUF2927 domain-containing protein n=2 Tax=Paraliobacillus quinghaiensis TaxID=470815 RepID=A0A917TWD9_9BACI|nr:DUF2927 domain-containing protein [Paraliobacillus quinghaiensis]GGM41235.1 hypothetical protein GCM10011351_29280 [Paraliobacillus quinghaiensis]
MKRTLSILFIIVLTTFTAACNEKAPEKPIIEGVEKGKVYDDGIKITVKNKQKDVVYKSFINEEPYELGVTFDENGKHTVKVIAEQNEKETETTVSFEIDDVPPKKPIVNGVEEGKIYADSVEIDFEKEEGVSYSVKIDEEPYKLNTPYKKEGKHRLSILATKESNKLTVEKEVTFTIDHTTYTKKEVEYFTEIALGSEYGGDPYVKKWLEDIYIKVQGNPKNADLETIDKVVKELNDIIKTVNIQVIKENEDTKENVNIYFVPQGDFRKYIPNATLGNWAYFTYFPKTNGEITEAIITIGTFGSDQIDRDHQIREELTQILGLGNDSPKYEDSIFHEDEGQSLNLSYSKLDKKVIELLYRKDIEIGMREKEILETLDERTK